ncbi:hypothetical protein C8R47DRAFT_1205580 [Mycena vitilis]|nr:hypothetical protein C8R47DRAFT_1205580 [Mycena vitilis]
MATRTNTSTADLQKGEYYFNLDFDFMLYLAMDANFRLNRLYETGNSRGVDQMTFPLGALEAAQDFEMPDLVSVDDDDDDQVPDLEDNTGSQRCGCMSCRIWSPLKSKL